MSDEPDYTEPDCKSIERFELAYVRPQDGVEHPATADVAASKARGEWNVYFRCDALLGVGGRLSALLFGPAVAASADLLTAEAGGWTLARAQGHPTFDG